MYSNYVLGTLINTYLDTTPMHSSVWTFSSTLKELFGLEFYPEHWTTENNWQEDYPHIPLPQGSGWDGNWTWHLQDETNHLVLTCGYHPMDEGYYTDWIDVEVVIDLTLLEDWLKKVKGVNDKEPEHPVISVNVIYDVDGWEDVNTDDAWDDGYFEDCIYEAFIEARDNAIELLRKNVIECSICEDCLMYLESEGDEPEQCDPLFNHYLGTASGEDDFHDEFSWQSCDCCGSQLGGARYKVYCMDENHPLRKQQ